MYKAAENEKIVSSDDKVKASNEIILELEESKKSMEEHIDEIEKDKEELERTIEIKDELIRKLQGAVFLFQKLVFCTFTFVNILPIKLPLFDKAHFFYLAFKFETHKAEKFRNRP